MKFIFWVSIINFSFAFNAPFNAPFNVPFNVPLNAPLLFDDIDIIEPPQLIDAPNCILFFTGGSNIMTYEIYSNFLNKLTKYNNAIFIVPFKYKYTTELINILREKYNNVIPIGHSSGCSTLIDVIQNTRLNSCVLLDPVDVRIIKMEKIKLPFLKRVLFINANKSYNGKPISFIPEYFKLLPTSFEVSNDCIHNIIEYDGYGHCDILNHIYSNFMYNIKICDGTNKRKKSELNNYHELLAQNISTFIADK